MRLSSDLLKYPLNNPKGFTLLELMITMIFIGILVTIAYPNYTKQVGKSRESEIKFVIGTINRAQQAYHWEKKQFAQGATDADSLVLLNVSANSKYISGLNINGDDDSATVAPTNNNYENYQIRAYAGGMFTQAGNYSQVICQSAEAAENITPPTNSTDCGSNQILD